MVFGLDYACDIFHPYLQPFLSLSCVILAIFGVQPGPLSIHTIIIYLGNNFQHYQAAIGTCIGELCARSRWKISTQ